MDRTIKILNIAAFACSLGAVLLILLLASGWAPVFMEVPALNRAVSNLVAGYCCCYGLSQWIQKSNRTFAVGLMVIGILIISANIISAQLN